MSTWLKTQLRVAETLLDAVDKTVTKTVENLSGGAYGEDTNHHPSSAAGPWAAINHDDTLGPPVTGIPMLGGRSSLARELHEQNLPASYGTANGTGAYGGGAHGGAAGVPSLGPRSAFGERYTQHQGGVSGTAAASHLPTSPASSWYSHSATAPSLAPARSPQQHQPQQPLGANGSADDGVGIASPSHGYASGSPAVLGSPSRGQLQHSTTHATSAPQHGNRAVPAAVGSGQSTGGAAPLAGAPVARTSGASGSGGSAHGDGYTVVHRPIQWGTASPSPPSAADAVSESVAQQQQPSLPPWLRQPVGTVLAEGASTAKAVRSAGASYGPASAGAASAPATSHSAGTSPAVLAHDAASSDTAAAAGVATGASEAMPGPSAAAAGSAGVAAPAAGVAVHDGALGTRTSSGAAAAHGVDAGTAARPSPDVSLSRAAGSSSGAVNGGTSAAAAAAGASGTPTAAAAAATPPTGGAPSGNGTAQGGGAAATGAAPTHANGAAGAGGGMVAGAGALSGGMAKIGEIGSGLWASVASVVEVVDVTGSAAASGDAAREAQQQRVIESLRKRLEAAKDENHQLEDMLARAEARSTQNHAALMQVRQELSAAQDSQAKAEVALASATASHQAVMREQTARLEAALRNAAALEGQLAALEATNKLLASSKNEMEGEMLEALRSELSLAEGRLEAERRAHQAVKAAALSRERELEQRIADSSDGLASLQRQAEEAAWRSRDLESQLALVSAERGELAAQVAALQQALGASGAAVDGSGAGGASSKSVHGSRGSLLELQMDALHAELASVRRALQLAEAAKTPLEAQLSAAQQELSVLREAQGRAQAQDTTRLEAQLREVSDVLYLKQTQLERLASEKAAQQIKLEKELQATREELARAIKATSGGGGGGGATVVDVGSSSGMQGGGGGLVNRGSAGFWSQHDVVPMDALGEPYQRLLRHNRVGKAVRAAAGFVDKSASSLVYVLRTYPLGRLGLFAYLVLIHLYVYMLISTMQRQAMRLEVAGAVGAASAPHDA